MTTLSKLLGGPLSGGIAAGILGVDTGASVPTWIPSSTPNLLVWPRADSASASPVNSLPDKSGNGYTLAASAEPPSWSATGAAGGQANLNFLKASIQGLTTSATVVAGIGTGDYAIGAVVRTVSATEAQAICRFSSTQTDFALFSGTFAIFNGAWHQFTTAPAINTWYSVLTQRVSGVVELWVDGVKDPTTFSSTVNAGDGQFYMGHDPANYFDGDIPEIAFWKQSLSAGDIANWFSYTHARYGI